MKSNNEEKLINLFVESTPDSILAFFFDKAGIRKVIDLILKRAGKDRHLVFSKLTEYKKEPNFKRWLSTFSEIHVWGIIHNVVSPHNGRVNFARKIDNDIKVKFNQNEYSVEVKSIAPFDDYLPDEELLAKKLSIKVKKNIVQLRKANMIFFYYFDARCPTSISCARALSKAMGENFSMEELTHKLIYTYTIFGKMISRIEKGEWIQEENTDKYLFEFLNIPTLQSKAY